MKVHIVSKHPDEDRVLGRLARTLATVTGWSHSHLPRTDVDLNYIIPYIYLAEQLMDWTGTPLAAYFSHLEPDNPGKRRMWMRAAEKVALATITAEQYRDVITGIGLANTHLCRPPIDPQFRRIRTRIPDPNRLTVGVSGFSYRNERKGEGMLARLLKTETAGRVRWLATGGGWPAPLISHLLPWEEMPTFYNSLDLLICTSTIEGVPMPPLEALAMGVPVIIPTGVGLLDSLPDTLGIWRFNAGDETHLAATFAAAIDYLAQQDYSPVALRDAVRDYTPEGWAFDHQTAFATIEPRKRQVATPSRRSPLTDAIGGLGGEENAAAIRPQTPRAIPTSTAPPAPQRIAPRLTGLPPEPPAPTAPWSVENAGIYVVAYGDQARECAARLLATIHQHMPGLPTMLVSSEPWAEPPGGTVISRVEPEVDIGARAAKTRIYELSPQEWEYVLYLDADTELVAPIPYLFDLLAAGWEFAICKNPQRFHIARHMARPDNVEECKATFEEWGTDEMMQWNGGVFSFRRTPATEAFFTTWHTEWQRWGKRDQGALLRALWRHPMRAVWLGNEWNTVTRYVPTERTAGIIHHVEEARRWNGVIPERSDSPEAWARVTAHQRAGTVGVTPSRRTRTTANA